MREDRSRRESAGRPGGVLWVSVRPTATGQPWLTFPSRLALPPFGALVGHVGPSVRDLHVFLLDPQIDHEGAAGEPRRRQRTWSAAPDALTRSAVRPPPESQPRKCPERQRRAIVRDLPSCDQAPRSIRSGEPS